MKVDRPSTVVIGIGNEYRGDDGAGIAVARRLRAQLPTDIKIIEASGEGAALLDAWQGATSVVLLDAVQSGALPGTVHRFDASVKPIPGGFFHYSTHTFSLAEAVELSRALHQLPPHLIVYGIEGSNFAPAAGLSAAVEEGVASVLAQVVSELHVACPGEV